MKYILYINIILLFVACNQTADTSTLKNHQKPVGISKMSEICVIADQDVWEGATGDTLRYYFESPYPLLPRPEPMFDLRHFTPLQLKEAPLRTTLRSYLVLADLSDADSETTQMVKRDMGEQRFDLALKDGKPTSLIGKDKWAQKQLIAYVFGKDEKSLQAAIRGKYPTVAKKVRENDEPALEASVYALGASSNTLRRRINEDFGVDLSLSGDYKEAVYSPETGQAWFRRDGKKGIQNIAIQKIKYTSDSQLSPKNMAKVFNEFGKEFVETSTEGSHLVVNDDDLPILTYDHNMGDLKKEYRGVWEMTQDFSGGPFVSYAYVNEDNLLFVTGFVLAQGAKKREMLMQLDFIAKKNYKKIPK